jgi:hypothetical protein
MNREILISLGISTLGTLLVLFYLRNKINDVESKVELMFQLIQNHENERKMANKIKVSEMENIAPTTQSYQDTNVNNNLIVVSDEDDHNDDMSSDDSDDSDSDDSESEGGEGNTITLSDEKHNIQIKLDELGESKNNTSTMVDELNEGGGEKNDEEGGEEEEYKGEGEEEEEEEEEEEDEEEEDEEEEDEEEEDEEDGEGEEKQNLEVIDYANFRVSELKNFCAQKGLSKYGKLNKQGLIDLLNAE